VSVWILSNNKLFEIKSGDIVYACRRWIGSLEDDAKLYYVYLRSGGKEYVIASFKDKLAAKRYLSSIAAALNAVEVYDEEDDCFKKNAIVTFITYFG